ncbi:MAG: hypothetical protein ABIL58_10410 [Pseudomonadota bacterium]
MPTKGDLQHYRRQRETLEFAIVEGLKKGGVKPETAVVDALADSVMLFGTFRRSMKSEANLKMLKSLAAARVAVDFTKTEARALLEVLSETSSSKASYRKAYLKLWEAFRQKVSI